MFLVYQPVESPVFRSCECISVFRLIKQPPVKYDFVTLLCPHSNDLVDIMNVPLFLFQIPKLEFNDTVQDYRITTGITGLADGLRHNDSALILAVISFMLWSTWRLLGE